MSQKIKTAEVASTQNNLDVLNKIAQSAGHAESVESLLQSIYPHLQQLIPLSSAGFGWVDDTVGVIVEWLVFLGDRKKRSKGQDEIPESLVKKAVFNGDVLVVNDIGETSESVADTPASMVGEQRESLLVIPIQDQQGVFGVLVLTCRGSRQYTQNDADFLSLISVLITGALRSFQTDLVTDAERAKLQVLLHNVDTGVAVLDEDFQIVYANEWLRNNLGASESDRICYTALFGREEPCEGCYLHQLRDGSRQSLIVEVGNADRWYGNRIFPLTEKNGRKYYLELIEDRTLHRRFNTELDEKNRLQTIIRFTRSIGHELNQPLTGISGYCALIKEEVDKSSSIYQDVIEIEKQALRLERIVHKFQSFTHFDYKEQKS